MVSKRGKNKRVKKDFYLYVFDLLKQGKNPAIICKELSISKQALNYHISSLKKKGLIEKIGYGTWEVKEVKTSKNSNEGNSALELIRGHGFAFKIPLKELRNWERRAELLNKRNINFSTIQSKIIKFSYKKHKIWLSSKAIIIYFPQDNSYWGKTSKESQDKAIYDFKMLCNGLFRFIGLNLPKFEYCIIKHHYSLVENELAKDYNRNGKKLILENKGKVWGLIDNSLNLNEFETISKESDKDNISVQNFFNDLKNNPATISEITKLVQGVTANQVAMDMNFKSHLQVIRELGKAVNELREQISKINTNGGGK